ncbi:MAG: hypothetical protein JWM06_445 [Actinomycetia bacterium]|nr:hypothetical protein [Actinomycetes bacterium]
MDWNIFEDNSWLMSFGERAALEGILSLIRPSLAVEVGSWMGGGLERTALYADEVHSFDLVVPDRPSVLNDPKVTLHTGDSHVLLAPWLAEQARDERVVDYILIDGDHSAEGAAKDIGEVLSSTAFSGVMLIHDTFNPEVRAGVELVRPEQFPYVRYVDLDFVTGILIRRPGEAQNEMWGGLGLIVVDRFDQLGQITSGALEGAGPWQDKSYDVFGFVKPVRDLLQRSAAAA